MPIDFRSFGNTTRLIDWRAGFLAWPAWARVALMIPMIPGILLIALSIVVFLVSLLTLFVLTAPVYALLSRLFTVRNVEPDIIASPGSKRVEAVIRDV